MRVLGSAGYYRRYSKNLSDVVSPLTDLLAKNVKFVWTARCQSAFDQLKAMLSSVPVLLAPNFDKMFTLFVDSSDIGVGSVLMQTDENDVYHPVCYYSKKFDKHHKRYSTIEKEALALLLALKHYEVYVGSGPIEVFTDHNPLIFLTTMRNKNRRLTGWFLCLQEYDLNIKHIRGKDNLISDCLSRV